MFSFQRLWNNAWLVLEGFLKQILRIRNQKIIFYRRVFLFIYLDWLETICTVFPRLLCHSVVSACLLSPSSKNLLICPVAMSSAEDVGRGKSLFGLQTLLRVYLILLHWSSVFFVFITFCIVCILPQVSKSKDPRGWSPQHLLPGLWLLPARACGSHWECGV